MSPSWFDEPLTDEEAAKQGRVTVRIAVVLAIAFMVLLATALAFGLSASGARATDQTTVGKAVYGYGQISYGGKGPEAWRWEKIRADRSNRLLQARLTVRVLQVQSLRRQVALLDRLNFDPVLAIRVVFGPYSAEALRVAYCETGGTYDLAARNGQYRGLFQMGSSERHLYGHGSTALAQARAAYAYFAASDRDWSPWECKP